MLLVPVPWPGRRESGRPVSGSNSTVPEYVLLSVMRYCPWAGAPAHGQYLITLSNTYSGTVEFDPETGLPLSRRPGHGTGTKSIRELARKNGAQADFSAENGVFRLHLLL